MSYTRPPHTFFSTCIMHSPPNHSPSTRQQVYLDRMHNIVKDIYCTRQEMLSHDSLLSKQVDACIYELEDLGAEGWETYFEECKKGKAMKKKVKKSGKRLGKAVDMVERLVRVVEKVEGERDGLRRRGDGKKAKEEEKKDAEEMPRDLDALCKKIDTCCCVEGSQGSNHVRDAEANARTRDDSTLNLRGGSSSPLPDSLVAAFERLATATPIHPSPQTEPWIHIAGLLQLRNAHLERQLSEYKDLYNSAIEDLQWNMDMCADLEESLDLYEDEKIESAVDLGFLKKRIAQLEAESKQTDSNSQLLTADTPAPKSFTFYARLSLILIPALPTLTLQFAPYITLPQIHALLTRIPASTNKFLQLSPAAKIVRDILLKRDALGIALPESLRNDAVMISLPEAVESGVDVVDATVKIAAWETFSNSSEGEWVQFRSRSTERQNREAEKLFGDGGYGSAYDNEGGMSVCSCHLCLEPYGAPPPPTFVSIRGGFDEEDDDDDYYDDDYDDDDEDSPDTDDEEEVEHEDEAHDWEY
jgi:hypothetical protein